MPAIPALITAGGAIGSTLLSKKLNKPSAAETGALQTQTDLAKQQATTGQQLLGTGMPLLKSGADYYSKLLYGSRGAMGQAVQPEATAIGDLYSGAEKAVGHGTLQGAERSQALADIAREKSGRIAGLIPGIRPGAAASLSTIGQNVVGGGAGLLGAAGGASSDAFRNQLAATQYHVGQSSLMGENFGKLLTQILSVLPKSTWNPGGTSPAASGGYSGTGWLPH